MLSTYVSLAVPLFVSEHDILKTNEPMLMPVGKSIGRQEHKMFNFGGQEVKDHGHTRS